RQGSRFRFSPDQTGGLSRAASRSRPDRGVTITTAKSGLSKRRSLRDFHPEFFEEEGPAVGGFFDTFGCRFAGAVTSFGFDSNQSRFVAILGCLECSGEFETVRRDYAIVVIGRRDKRRRITTPLRDVLERRARVRIREVIRLLGPPVIRCPVPADGKFLETEHVHDANVWQSRAEKIGTLRHPRADEQSTVAAAANCELRCRCKLVID